MICSPNCSTPENATDVFFDIIKYDIGTQCSFEDNTTIKYNEYLQINSKLESENEKLKKLNRDLTLKISEKAKTASSDLNAKNLS